jgi:hypothetical protein
VKDRTTYGLSPERLARLLTMGLESACEERDHASDRPLAQMLRDMLARELPLDPATSDSLPALLKRPCEELSKAIGQTIGDLLLNPATDVAVIKAVKDYAKQLVRRLGPNSEQAPATAIYYAAIASALAFHRHKITQHSYEKLDKSFTELEQKPWVSLELKDLFNKARAACQQHGQKSE